MDARVSSLHEATEVVCASPRVGQRRVTHHHGCVDRLFMRTREEEVTLEVILYEYSRRMCNDSSRYVGQRQLTTTGTNRPENNYSYFAIKPARAALCRLVLVDELLARRPIKIRTTTG